MTLTSLQRAQACDLLRLELIVLEDRLRELHATAEQTGFTRVPGRLAALRGHVEQVRQLIDKKRGVL
jgi:hypothetical protein